MSLTAPKHMGCPDEGAVRQASEIRGFGAVSLTLLLAADFEVAQVARVRPHEPFLLARCARAG